MTQPEFGARLKRLRLERGLSQSGLAGEQLSTSYVSLLEAGQRQPTRKVAQQLATGLQVDLSYLLDGIEQSTVEELQLGLRLAELSLHGGDPVGARDRLEQLRSDATLASDRWRLDLLLARAHERSGDLDAAIELLEDLRDRGAAEPARWPWITVSMQLSSAYREAGDVDRAADVAERAVERARQLVGDLHPDLPRLVVTWAAASRERGDLAHAGQLLRRLLLAMDDQTSQADRGSALWNGAVIAADRGEYAEALLLAERALDQFAAVDQHRERASLQTLLAWILLESPDGDAGTAEGLLTTSRAELLAAGMVLDAAYAETELARASSALGRPADAVEWATQALSHLGEAGKLEAARARLAMARGLLALGESSSAALEMELAAGELARMAASRQAAAVWRDLAELEAAAGQPERAQQAFRQALDATGVRGTPMSVAVRQ